MREYYIRFAVGYEGPALIILPSWWKLIWWLLRKSWRCSFLDVYYQDPLIHGLEAYLEETADPCDSCLSGRSVTESILITAQNGSEWR